MSRVRLTKIAQPSSPPTNTGEVYFDTTINGPCFVDQGGNRCVLGTVGGNNSYRLIGFTLIQQGTTTYNSQAHGPASALYIECIGAGGAGGGGQNGNTTSTGIGSGGGGGGYSAAFVTLTSLGYTSNTAMVCAVGAGGTNAANTAGSAGGNTSFNNGTTGQTLFLRAQGGSGGGCINGVTITAIASVVVGAAGGVVDATQTTGNNFLQLPGSPGGAGVRLNGIVVYTGDGGAPGGPYSGGVGLGLAVNATLNSAGTNAGGFGCGGSGGYSNATAGTAGGTGSNGVIKVWEFAGT